MTLYHLRERIEAIGFRIEELILRILHRRGHIDIITCPIPVAGNGQRLDEHTYAVKEVHL